MNNMGNGNSKERSVNFRVNEEVSEKLDYLAQTSGKSISSVIRELIADGEVKNIYNGRQLIKDVAALHSKINQYVLTIDDEIQKVKADIKDIKIVMQEKNINYDLLDFYLDKADRQVDYLQESFTNKISVYTRVLDKGSNDYGNF